jgi:opacity protein-like surface antigen
MKIIPWIVLALTSCNAFANGIYAGIAGGYQSNINPAGVDNVGNDVGWAEAYGFPLYGESVLARPEGNGAVGSLFLGYRLDNLLSFHNMNGFLEVEGNGEWANTVINQSEYSTLNDGDNSVTNTTSYNMTQRGALGVALHPGIQFNNQGKLYGIIGYEAGRVNFNLSSTTTTSTVTGQLQLNDNKWLNGLRFGIGIGYPVTENLGIRAEFTQTEYKSFELKGNESGTGVLIAGDYSPVSRIAAIGVVWNFERPAVAVATK